MGSLYLRAVSQQEADEEDDETPLTAESLFRGIENRMNRHPSPAVGLHKGARSPFRDGN